VITAEFTTVVKLILQYNHGNGKMVIPRGWGKIHSNYHHSGNTAVQETQLSLTNRATRLEVSQGQQTWYHSIC